MFQLSYISLVQTSVSNLNQDQLDRDRAMDISQWMNLSEEEIEAKAIQEECAESGTDTYGIYKNTQLLYNITNHLQCNLSTLSGRETWEAYCQQVCSILVVALKH